MKTIAVFADVQNIYYTCREVYGRPFNYRLFWQQLHSQYQIKYATAYAIERHDDQQRKFQDALRHIGFNVKLKPYILRSDGSSKGDWDVGITIDMLTQAPEVDEVLLLSGDGDFALLLSTIRERFGTGCIVQSASNLTAQSLIQSADQHWPITAQMLVE